MKKFVFLISLLCTVLFASATDYYVSNSGNDQNSGTSPSSPWKSINKVNAQFSKLRPGDRILFRKGDTFYGSIVANRSGSAGAPIVIGAYGSGVKPVITGLKPVDNWRSKGGNIWESVDAVSSLPYTQIVVVNGRNTPMGKYPNDGYVQWQSRSGDDKVFCNSLSGSNWTGAEIALFTTPYLVHRSKILLHIGNSLVYEKPNHSITWQTPGSYFKADFVIQNDIRTLDAQNEWYYNPSTKKLFIYSNGSPEGVSVASQNILIDVKHRVDHITIENLFLEGAGEYGVQLGVSKYVTIQGCDFEKIGKIGVIGANHGEYVPGTRIENCSISQVYGNGIDLSPYFTNAQILDNKIWNIGMLPSMANGGMSAQGIDARGDHTVIGYNQVDSTGSSGIQFRGNYTIVHNNYVKNFCIAPGYKDGGGIYTWAGHNLVVKGSKVVDNIVMHGTIYSKAIDLDDGSNGIEVTGNTAVDAERGIYLHNVRNVKVYNNTTFDNYEMGLLISRDNASYTTENVDVKDNIFFAKETRQFAAWFSRVGKDTRGFESDRNYYVKPLSASKLMLTYSGPVGTDSKQHYAYPNLAEWQRMSGKDQNSTMVVNTTNDIKNIRFEYNATKSVKTVSLGGIYVDAKGKTYRGSIVLQPFTSAVLVRTGSYSNAEPKVNAGENQTITLPKQSVVLKGTASDSDGSIDSYSWTQVSGPSKAQIDDEDEAETTVEELKGGVYVFELTVFDNMGASATSQVTVTVNAKSVVELLPAVNIASSENGVAYKYYEGEFTKLPDFTALSVKKVGKNANFDLSPASSADRFALEISALIAVPEDGEYTFYLNSDDGSKLYIDGKLVIDNDGLHGAKELSGSVGLQKGNHIIKVEYFQLGGGKGLSVQYKGPGTGKQAIPNTSLYLVPDQLLPAVTPQNVRNGLSYKYYEGSYNSMPDFSNLQQIGAGTANTFDISKAKTAVNFLFVFEGFVEVPADGQYTFYTSSDDGSMLYIDDLLVVDNNGSHALTEKSGSVGLKAGKHAIRLEYFQLGGGKALEVQYEGAGVQKSIIPASALFRTDLSGSDEVHGDYEPGVNYKYYEGGNYNAMPKFNLLTPKKAGVVSTFNLDPADKLTSYLFEFEGYIKIPADGDYTFYVTSDDGGMLYIGEDLVVDNDGDHAAKTEKGTVYLTEGYHPIKVEYFQQGGGRTLLVEMETINSVRREVPADMLFRETLGLAGTAASQLTNGIRFSYYEASTFGVVPDFKTITAMKSGIINSIHIGPAERAEVFAFNFEGYIKIVDDGYYTFYSNSDDGSLLYINGMKIVDNDGLHGHRERSGKIYLTKGFHTINVKYFQETGLRNLEVSYSGPGISKVVIPENVLFVKKAVATSLSRYAATGPLASLKPVDVAVAKVSASTVQAYPNPFMDYIQVTLGNAEGRYQIDIVDVNGRVVFTKEGRKNAGYYAENVSTSSFQQGNYFVRVTQGAETKTVKVQKR